MIKDLNVITFNHINEAVICHWGKGNWNHSTFHGERKTSNLLYKMLNVYAIKLISVYIFYFPHVSLKYLLLIQHSFNVVLKLVMLVIANTCTGYTKADIKNYDAIFWEHSPI